ncbi:hypothetical protein RI129_006146 [Pyrocoelia pectoralis]|uniref:Major facilitator superfamily (MFS) profile domain-containing protein n=1 Tax=Pyrocoelia pectoralis TaxID=417401 RepID=A0AAN7VFY3_9COLE
MSTHFSDDVDCGTVDDDRQKASSLICDREFFVNAILTACVVVGAASSGMAMGYPAILLPQLKSNNSTLYTDDEMGSWIASIISASMPIGSVISGILVDKIGRKLTLHAQPSLVILGCLLIAFAHNHAMILVGRLICGMASGWGMVACQVYVGEVSTPKARGILSSTPFVSYALGILLVYALGSLEWRVVAGLSTITSIISVLMYFLCRESHVWLIRQGKIREATIACIWFRGNKIKEAHKEIEEIITRYKNEKIVINNWKCVFEPYSLKPLVITTIFNLLQTLSGVYVVVFYASDLIGEMGIGNLEISEMFAAILTAVVRLAFSIVACLLLHRINRRSLALLSGLSTAVTALTLGICLHFQINSYFMPICLLVYVAANTIGLLILPGVMIGELFPARVRGITGGLSYTLLNIFMFGVAKLYPWIKGTLKIYGLFCLFGVSALLLCVLVYFTLPETRNKTLGDVEDYFKADGIFWSTKKEKKVLEAIDSSRKVADTSI